MSADMTRLEEAAAQVERSTARLAEAGRRLREATEEWVLARKSAEEDAREYDAEVAQPAAEVAQPARSYDRSAVIAEEAAQPLSDLRAGWEAGTICRSTLVDRSVPQEQHSCELPTGHAGLHSDSRGAGWGDAEAIEVARRTT